MLDIFTMLFLGKWTLEISHDITIVLAVLHKLITRVVIATSQHTSFLGFYSYLYSSGAYPARLEQLL